MIPDLNATALFVRVIETGSFTAAAREAGLPKSTVSRQIADLERRLGATLLHRSTRALSPTDVGRELYDRAANALREAQTVIAGFSARRTGAVGTVRVSATSGFAQIILAPILHAVLREEPDLRIDLRLSDTRVDVIEDGIDLAIRMGRLENSELKARKLCRIGRLICASPGYISLHGMPTDVLKLSRHEAIVTAAHLNRWTFADGTETTMRWRFSAGNILLARDAALHGKGLALLPRFLISEELANGQLIEVLADRPMPAADATALLPADKLPAPATAALLDRIVAHLKGREL